MATRATERLAKTLIAGIALVATLPLVAPADGARIENQRKRVQVRAQMKAILSGLFGGRSSVGYIGDMGGLPATLETLAASTGSPAYSTANNGDVGMGFNGPYVVRTASADSTFLDPWSSPIEIVSTASTVQLRSAGPDQDIGTTEDNVLYPLTARTTHGTIDITVTSVLESGGSPVPVGDSDVAVTVYYSADGIEASAAADYTGSGGVFRSPSMHVGRHYVSVSALAPEDYTVSTDGDVVWLRSGRASAQLELVAADPTTVCHDPSGTSPRTMTVSGAALGAHLAHGDTAGSCSGAETTTLCHKPAGPHAKTLTVPSSDASGHYSHGDSAGACP